MPDSSNNRDVRTRKINAVLSGDSAVDAELLIVRLGLAESGKKKADIDAELVNLALEALAAVVDATISATGNKYPSVDILRKTMGKRFVVGESD